MAHNDGRFDHANVKLLHYRKLLRGPLGAYNLGRGKTSASTATNFLSFPFNIIAYIPHEIHKMKVPERWGPPASLPLA